MKSNSSPFLNALMVLIVILFISSRSERGTIDKISVSEFELVDKNGKQRVSIKIEEDGEVVFRLRDKTGNVRLKMGANEDGSGLVLLDGNTEPGIHALAKKGGSSLTILDKDGMKKEY